MPDIWSSQCFLTYIKCILLDIGWESSCGPNHITCFWSNIIPCQSYSFFFVGNGSVFLVAFRIFSLSYAFISFCCALPTCGFLYIYPTWVFLGALEPLPWCHSSVLENSRQFSLHLFFPFPIPSPLFWDYNYMNNRPFAVSYSLSASFVDIFYWLIYLPFYQSFF